MPPQSECVFQNDLKRIDKQLVAKSLLVTGKPLKLGRQSY